MSIFKHNNLGESCENTFISGSQENNACKPCNNNFMEYFECLLNYQTNYGYNKNSLDNYFLQSCRTNVENCDFLHQLNCGNQQPCEIIVGTCIK